MTRTTREDIKEWLMRAKKEKAKYMIIVCDTFDWDDYPVNCKTAEECKEKIANPGSMQKVMECYDLKMNIEDQLNEDRAHNEPK